MAKQYLYAAAVQGIQDFIFATNALKEIAGASELVEQICTKELCKLLGKENYKENQLLIGAAGNIKYLFENKSLCEKVVKEFPFIVAEMALGITLSQTVIEIEGDINSCHIDMAEKNLKTQRNLAMRPSTMGWMIAKRVPKTGLPVVDKVEGDFIDISTQEKRSIDTTNTLFEKMIKEEDRESVKGLVKFAKELKHIAVDNHSWIAVIHADGNDLGKKIPTLFGSISGDAFVEKQRKFSETLDKCTQRAAQKALYATVFHDKTVFEKLHKGEIIPVRPVVCGGDDLTIIVPASIALDFTQRFLQAFEDETKEAFKGWKGLENGLTACAGIAYITQKYPFHYGVDLADELCGHAKKHAKKLGKEPTPSCLSFYKIQSSFVRNYEDIEKMELKANALTDTLSNCPYYLHEQEGSKTVDNLKKWVHKAKDKRAIASRLRQVLSMLHTKDKETIEMELARIESLNKNDFRAFGIDAKDVKTLTHLHDFLSLNSFQK